MGFYQGLSTSLVEDLKDFFCLYSARMLNDHLCSASPSKKDISELDFGLSKNILKYA